MSTISFYQTLGVNWLTTSSKLCYPTWKDANLKLVYTIWMYQLKFESYMVANKHSVSTYAGGHNLFTGVKMEWSSDRDAEPVHHEIQFKRNIDYRS